jgi:hypothetical protein
VEIRCTIVDINVLVIVSSCCHLSEHNIESDSCQL